jgi:hypothetical protein
MKILMHKGGRISMDCSSKATMPLTIARPIFKSFAEDSFPRSSTIAMQSTRAQFFPLPRGGYFTHLCFRLGNYGDDSRAFATSNDYT